MKVVYVDKKRYNEVLEAIKANSSLNQGIQPLNNGAVLYYKINNDAISITHKTS